MGNRIRYLVPVLAVLASACGASSESLPFEPAGPQVAPDPGSPGPFPVGVRTLDLSDPSRIDERTGKPRRLRTEIWYPAEQKHRKGPFHTYDFSVQAREEELGDKLQVVLDTNLPLLESTAVKDANIDRQHGPYPLILFSHGAYGLRQQSISYTIHLASHGYVVAAPDHQGNTVWDMIRDGYHPGSVPNSSYLRVQDMKFLLQVLLQRAEDPEDPLYWLLDFKRAGVSGHSFGGWTTVCMPCQDVTFVTGVALSPLISLAIGFGCELADYPAPLMVMHGDQDYTLPYRDTYCDYRTMGGAELRLVEIRRGGHYTFTDICDMDLDYLAQRLGISDAEDALHDGCSPTENLNYHEAHRGIHHYAAAWFNLWLRNSPASRDYLIEKSEPPFDSFRLYADDIPDWPDGGCD
ncbi:MAG: hypothetical protein GYA21_14820 [Myxococcales bacterium]|nr:hypothetical protein [Myxococcales bacterium]